MKKRRKTGSPDREDGPRVQVEFYTNANGKRPAYEWLSRQNDEVKERFRGYLQDLENHGPDAKTVYGKVFQSLRHKLFEICVKAANKEEYRLIFFFRKGKAVVCHGFQKKTEKTPDREIEIALDRKADYERSHPKDRKFSTMEENKRRNLPLAEAIQMLFGDDPIRQASFCKTKDKLIISNLLRLLRTELDLPVEEFARITNLESSFIYDMEQAAYRENPWELATSIFQSLGQWREEFFYGVRPGPDRLW